MTARSHFLKSLITLLLLGATAFTVSIVWHKEALPIESTPAPHFKVTIPQKAILKNYVTVSVEAPAGTSCELTFIPASGETQVMNTTANAEGICEWRWKLEESYGKGNARLIFTINGVSDTHFIEIRSSF